MNLVHSFVWISALCGANDVQLLSFSAKWCSGCEAVKPALHELENAGYPIRHVDVDRDPNLARRFQVQSVPAFILVSSGNEVQRIQGPASARQLADLFRQAKSSTRRLEPAADSGEKAALEATVRLRIEDDHGQSYGTGTIVDVHGPDALILTCGHIFRDSGGRGRIVVDMLAPCPDKQIQGQLLRFDLERDVALLAIRSPVPLRPARIAGPNYRVNKNAPVFSVGCDHGRRPSVMRGQVNALNKYLGAANLTVSGQPVDGRSGGGLFSRDGQLIGVCNAADPKDDEGLFAALPSVYRELDLANLSSVYRRGAVKVADTTPRRPRSVETLAGASLETAQNRAVGPKRRFDVKGMSYEPVTRADNPSMSVDQGYLQSLEAAEVVCIVRSTTDPKAKSQVFVFDRPSRDFLSTLNQERQQQRLRRNTEMRRVKPYSSQRRLMTSSSF